MNELERKKLIMDFYCSGEQQKRLSKRFEAAL